MPRVYRRSLLLGLGMAGVVLVEANGLSALPFWDSDMEGPRCENAVAGAPVNGRPACFDGISRGPMMPPEWFRACSSAWLERVPDKDEVRGSSPRTPIASPPMLLRGLIYWRPALGPAGTGGRPPC